MSLHSDWPLPGQQVTTAWGVTLLTFRYGGLEFPGHLSAADLIPESYLSATGTAATTGHDAAVGALTTVAARVNAAGTVCIALLGDAPAVAPAPAGGREQPPQHGRRPAW
ncbi:hypothetical protein [Dactylosporangium sp. CA-139066]|uniref:hypothetical protein n=1 Tax=Dactylosporangium sp. CA-139066 TaxID=3239930 RepID=UPI003D8B5627